ncbi:MAG TPA: primosomal protein N' [Burkholderiales bacterium]|nr:primosomal protein N' [Burkholderiales bacterium]
MPIIRVALDVPLATLFDYVAHDGDDCRPGTLVEVPFGRKRIIGVVIEEATRSTLTPERLKTVIRPRTDLPRLDAAMLEVFRFCSDYYHFPLGTVILQALPARLRRTGASLTKPPCERYEITAAGTALDQTALPKRATARRALLERLSGGGLMDEAVARSITPDAGRILKDFIARGWVAARPAVDAGLSAPPRGIPPRFVSGPALTPAQTHAVAEINAARARFTPWLLHGVTGSGKTEVYLHAIAAALAAGRQALLLVPEIALTPQLETMLAARFPDTKIASLHSNLNDSERLHHWLSAERGEARIVLGTRLAAFTPLAQPGLIVVDEEHDASFKQQDGLHYSARDVAIYRARRHRIPIILGSATPSLETWHNAGSGRFHLLTLDQRINAPLPHIATLDVRGERLDEGLSARLVGEMENALAREEQVLIFINRRGYAPALMCAACRWIADCRRCSAHLVLHLGDRRLKCHHCGSESPIPQACPECGNPDLLPVGAGTQRIESALARHFPQARILRVDRDTTRRKLAWSGMRDRIQSRQVDILVGTQILAKGHDFPHLNLVAVLNADASLYSTDFRAGERLFAQLMQVAGRAGRGATRGRVLIQTAFPQHPLYAALAVHDYKAFAEQLLAERRRTGFPPFSYQALLRAEAPKAETALDFLTAAAELARDLTHDVTVYDPVPALMARRAGRERAQLLVQSRSRPRLHDFLMQWRARLVAQGTRHARWSLEVDPLEF